MMKNVLLCHTVLITKICWFIWKNALRKSVEWRWEPLYAYFFSFYLKSVHEWPQNHTPLNISMILNCIVLVWCRLLLSKPTIYPTLPDVSKWQMSNLQSAENHLARGIRWCWKSSRTHACLQRLHFINIFSVRFAQYNRLQKNLRNFRFSNWEFERWLYFKNVILKYDITLQCRMNHSLVRVKGQVHTILFIPFISFK